MGMKPEPLPTASGIEQLRALMAAGRAGIARALEFDLTVIEDGFVIFEGTLGVHAYNPIGTVHGGYAATLLDSACGCAVHAKLSPTQAYTTLELKVAYHKASRRRPGSSGRRAGWSRSAGVPLSPKAA